MRHYAKKAGAVGFLVFLALWIIGSARGLTLPYPEPPPLHLTSIGEGFSSSGGRQANSNQGQYANNLKLLGMEKASLPMVIDQAEIDRIQIHEKTALLTSASFEYGDDEAKIRAVLATHKANTISENKTGIAPQRRLNIQVGVHPEKFESLVADLEKIGTLTSIKVEQNDRTEEFRKLHGHRQSVKKYLESLLKQRSAEKLSLDDALRLDQKIKETENELRPLSYQLGDFLGKESFYRVELTLVEHQPGDRGDKTFSVPKRIFHAFWWAIVWWLAAALVVGLVAGVGASVWVLREKAPA